MSIKSENFHSSLNIVLGCFFFSPSSFISFFSSFNVARFSSHFHSIFWFVIGLNALQLICSVVFISIMCVNRIEEMTTTTTTEKNEFTSFLTCLKINRTKSSDWIINQMLMMMIMMFLTFDFGDLTSNTIRGWLNITILFWKKKTF